MPAAAAVMSTRCCMSLQGDSKLEGPTHWILRYSNRMIDVARLYDRRATPGAQGLRRCPPPRRVARVRAGLEWSICEPPCPHTPCIDRITTLSGEPYPVPYQSRV